jgi:GMP synthase (glutamine-hydrolysing)
LDDRILEESDCLLVGGAGEFGIQDEVPEIERFVRFLSDAAHQGFPIFASCFGFHALVLGLGGAVTPDEDNAEVGTYDLTLSPAGGEDPLFKDLPTTFKAQLGHKDRATRLPDGCLNLASSARAPLQAFRVPGKPVYATQFHPELTDEDNRARFLRYMDQYGRLFGAEAAQNQLDGHVPSPEANQLIPRFVHQFLDAH